jgi:hypothetical protein
MPRPYARLTRAPVRTAKSTRLTALTGITLIVSLVEVYRVRVHPRQVELHHDLLAVAPASMGIVAGSAVVPSIWWASRAKPRNGSVRTNMVLTSSWARPPR